MKLKVRVLGRNSYFYVGENRGEKERGGESQVLMSTIYRVPSVGIHQAKSESSSTQ